MEITDASLHDLDQDESLDDGVAGGLDQEGAQVGPGQDAERVPKVALDLTLGSHADLVLLGRWLFLGDLLEVLVVFGLLLVLLLVAAAAFGARLGGLRGIAVALDLGRGLVGFLLLNGSRRVDNSVGAFTHYLVDF